MGMSTHIVGFVPADEEWNLMMKVWNACADAGVEVPHHVYEFFDGQNPNGQPGRTVDIEDSDAVSEYSADMENGYQVDLSKLPPNVKFIRVCNSY